MYRAFVHHKYLFPGTSNPRRRLNQIQVATRLSKKTFWSLMSIFLIFSCLSPHEGVHCQMPPSHLASNSMPCSGFPGTGVSSCTGSKIVTGLYAGTRVSAFRFEKLEFYIGKRKDELKTAKSISIHSSSSTLADRNMRRSGPEFSSQNVSNTNTESMGRSPFPRLTQRPSNLRLFTLAELKTATKNFNRTVKIGEGGFGCVYKCVIKSSEDPLKKLDVAVKQLGKKGLQGHKEWVTEVNVLGVVEHANLVKLVGYCAEDDERGIQRLLVYEYMPNRSVEDHLSSRSESPLPWAMRLKVAQDAARGLAYLHEGMDFQIIFRDFKSSNILLDEQWNAKLSDFGLARLGPSEGLTHVSTAVVGTMGYAAPEYIQTGRLTSKSDVWSYGVFIYELITGRRPLDKNYPKNEQKLLEWIKPYISDSKKFHQILDPRIEWNGSHKSAQKLAGVAYQCLTRHPKQRPKMSEVLEMVNRIVDIPQEMSSSQLPTVKALNQWNKPRGK